jgi:hypothetical protein
VGRILGILAIVLGVWIGVEVMMKGTDRAFGGLLARLGVAGALDRSDGERIDSRSVPVKAADRLRSAYDVGIDRVERNVPDE